MYSDELEAHIRDLRHTNDLTQQKMLRSELRIKELLEENDKLRSSNALNIQDLQDDRVSTIPQLMLCSYTQHDLTSACKCNALRFLVFIGYKTKVIRKTKSRFVIVLCVVFCLLCSL